MYYLYRITNQLNKKVYIGQTINPEDRWKQHLSRSRRSNILQIIHRAIAKYGANNFIYEIIACCLTQDNADETETLLIKQYDSRNIQHGYNLKPGGNSSIPSDETKHKMSIAQTPEDRRAALLKNPTLLTSPQRKKWSSKGGKNTAGIIRSDEDKLKNSIAHQGSKNYSALLKEEDVINIISLINKGVSEKEIAMTYSVKAKTISNIKNGSTWKQLLKQINYIPKHIRHNGKLTKNQVDEIKNLLSKGYSGKEIAKLFQISPSMVSCIKVGKTWK